MPFPQSEASAASATDSVELGGRGLVDEPGLVRDLISKKGRLPVAFGSMHRVFYRPVSWLSATDRSTVADWLGKPTPDKPLRTTNTSCPFGNSRLRIRKGIWGDLRPA